jgi:DNA modification methylase
MFQQSTFDFLEETVVLPKKAGLRLARAGTFTDNMSLPIHRWFRYSAGFSAEWVKRTILEQNLEPDDYVFDPFTGSGTTLLAAQSVGVNSAGTEYHPFICRIAKAKLSWNIPTERLFSDAEELLEKAKSILKAAPASESELIIKCYNPVALARLEALRDAYLDTYGATKNSNELLWLAITAILRECSGAGTAQWQYILPNKTKARVIDPFTAFMARIKLFCEDIQNTKRQRSIADTRLEFCDARDLNSLSSIKGRVKLVLTSPPYPNNYDYADATRLEMTFWGEIKGWGDLQKSVRHRLIRSCSQHSAAEKLVLGDLLADPAVRAIRHELTAVCTDLQDIRETKGGKKTYHTMVAAYFVDLAKTWQALLPLCTNDAAVCFVIGDSAPYGIHVPAERWLGELAVDAGFSSWTFEKIRDRNIKWKNRKHRVPLKEGYLWVKR